MRAVTCVLLVLAMVAAARASVSPHQVVVNIKALTSKSQALQVPANSISVINGPLIVIGLGPFPQIIAGFTDIVSTATTAIASMQGMAPVPAGADAKAIADAFREFVRVHQALLNILIGKAGLFNTVPIIGQPVSAVLRSIESVVDTIAFALIDLVQSEATRLTADAGSLKLTVQTSIKAYDGLSVDSLGLNVGGLGRRSRR